MPLYVAFLRAINVTGRFIKMAELAEHFHTLGYEDARSYINSGNIIFSTKVRSPNKLALGIEEGLAPLLGFTSEVFLRTSAEVQAIAQRAAQLRQRVPHSGEVNVAFLRAPLSDAQADELASMQTELDNFTHHGQEIYWLCMGKQMDSKFSNAALERRFRLRTTFRRVSMLQGLVEECRRET